MKINSEEIIKELDNILIYVSTKMELPISKSYEILNNRVKFEFAWSIVWIFLGVVVILIGFYIYHRIQKYLTSVGKDSKSYKELDGLQYLGSFLGLLIGIIIILPNIRKILEITLSPEWYMIEKFLELIE